MRKDGGGRDAAPKPAEKGRRPAGGAPRKAEAGPAKREETGSFGAALLDAFKRQ